jgi:hypothetical protein
MDHPYGRVLEVGDIENHITQENLQDYYQKQLLAGMEIVLAGKFDPEITGELETFADIQMIAGEEPFSDLIMQEAGKNGFLWRRVSDIHQVWQKDYS